MSNAQKWIQRHFKELVDKYPGKYVAVVENKIITSGLSSKDVEEEAQKRYPNKKLSIILVPRKEDLNCLLWNFHMFNMRKWEYR